MITRNSLSSEAGSRSETVRLLLNPKYHYCVHKSPSPPVVPILSQKNLVYTLTYNYYVFKIHFNIPLPSTPRSSKWSAYCWETTF